MKPEMTPDGLSCSRRNPHTRSCCPSWCPAGQSPLAFALLTTCCNGHSFYLVKVFNLFAVSKAISVVLLIERDGLAGEFRVAIGTSLLSVSDAGQ